MTAGSRGMTCAGNRTRLTNPATAPGLTAGRAYFCRAGVVKLGIREGRCPCALTARILGDATLRSMGNSTILDAGEALAAGYALDHLWRETMGLPAGDSKEGPLRIVAQLLERERVPYALIGGVAVQIHTQEPRSTLDIDLALRAYVDIPQAALLAAGFEHTGRYAHSDNWRAPGPGPLKTRTAVQFSAEDVGLADAVEHACVIDLTEEFRLRVATVADLIALKLSAAEEPERRASKREHDVADVLALLEDHPEVESQELRLRLHRVRSRLLGSPEIDDPSARR
jgi:hypothetical protein